MKKKILSLVLVVAMLASMLVLVPTSGATEKKATLAFGNAVGSQGDTVTVDFEVTTKALQGLQFMFEYDTSRLTLTNVTSAVSADVYNVMIKEMTGGAANAPFSSVGPYCAWSWSEVDGNTLDLSGGEVIATLTFTIKGNAPLGDACVRFAPLADGVYQPNKISFGDTDILTSEMAFVDGAVTVLPAGYGAAINVPESAWDIDENGVLYGLIADDKNFPGSEAFADKVIADTGALVIPSQIGGVDVVEIGAAAFDGYSFSTLVIPETVEFIAAGAVYNCENLTKAYVLGAETELEDAAIGYEGSWRNGNLRNPAILLNADETGALTTIYGVAGSTAETYANAGDGYDVFPFVAEGVYSVTFGGNTYLTGANVQAPGVAVDGDKLTVAWTDGTNTYGAGELMTLTGPVTLEPITITKPAVNSTLGFKIGEDEKGVFAAMRFTTDMAKADYEQLAKLGTVTMGTLITPARYVSHAGALTREALDQLSEKYGNIKTYVDVTTEGYFELDEENNMYSFAGSLKHIQDKNVDLTYAAAFYLTVETASGSFTVYSDFVFANNRDAYSAAQAVADGGYVGMTDPQIEVLDDFIADCAAIIASRENN